MHLSSLHLYPIKSARGVAVKEAQLDDFGLSLDRRWMVVDDAGDFITQRQAHEMALIDVAIGSDDIQLDSPGRSALRIPITQDEGPPIQVRVWDDVCPAIEVSAEASTWFSDYLSRPARLVFMPGSTFRRVNPDVVPAHRRVSFADAYPALLIGEASLMDLNSRLATPLPMNRFRPNLVIEGSLPFEEDQWRQVQVGDIMFDLVKRCDRCVTTTIDQATGLQGKEPLLTLSKFRKWNGQVYFGQNVVHQSSGTIRIGDEVRVCFES
ncbi:MAG: MOSC N-terminal beta barrel domain-containing protein [Gemmatimonadota bacterium]